MFRLQINLFFVFNTLFFVEMYTYNNINKYAFLFYAFFVLSLFYTNFIINILLIYYKSLHIKYN